MLLANYKERLVSSELAGCLFEFGKGATGDGDVSVVGKYFCTGYIVWGSCSKSLSQKLQNRAARVLTFSIYDRSTGELLRMVNWVKLDRQRLVDKSIMMYKIFCFILSSGFLVPVL